MNAKVKVTVISVIGDLRQGDLFSLDFGDTWHVFDSLTNGRIEVCGSTLDDNLATPDRPCAVRIYDRTDEALFRTCVPREVSDLTILEVSAFRPGSRPGFYATALAIAVNHLGAYSTHRIICADDHADGRRHWYLELSHYDYATRAQADADIVERRAN